MLDLVIQGGDVVDGARTPRFRADVGVQGDRIVSVGDLREAPARRRLDATGRCVAPGFIDVHNHSDGWLLRRPHLLAKTRQGFTTEVLAADGISYAPVDEHTAPQWLHYLRALDGLRSEDYTGWRSLEEYLLRIEGRNVQNAATHLPYANVRTIVCGWGRGPADDFQMRQIQVEIQRGMAEGAVGLSTGLDYIGQCFVTTDELVAACSAMASQRGLYVTHVRYKLGLLPALREAVEIGRRANVPVHISHLKATSGSQINQVLAFLDEARREVDLSFDVYPYQPGSTMLSYLAPYEIWERGPLAAVDRLADPVTRRRFAAGLDAYRLDLDHVRLAWLQSRDRLELQGLTLNEVARRLGRPPGESLLELLIEERLAVLCVMDEGDDALVRPFLQHDLYMMGSDGIYHEDGVVHPRVYGSAGRLLGPCVRDLRLFPLEDAVHKLSGRPAERFRLSDRGRIAEGKYADLVVFDPATVADQATFDQPHQPTVGIEHVVVNGEPILVDSAPVLPVSGSDARLPGRYLRRRG